MTEVNRNLQQQAASAQRPAATNTPVRPQADKAIQEDGMDLGEHTPVTSYNNDNSGALFANKKRTKETHPNSQGKAQIGGIWYWVSGWTKTPTAGGDKFISLAFTELTVEEVAKYC